VTATSDIGASASASFTWTTVNPADLSITNTASTSQLSRGQQITYILTATNSGGQDATGATVTDALPAGVQFDGSASSQGTCTTTTTPNAKSGAVVCNLGTLAGHSSATILIVVTPTKPGTIADTANVAAPRVTLDGDDTATATLTVLR